MTKFKMQYRPKYIYSFRYVIWFSLHRIDIYQHIKYNDTKIDTCVVIIMKSGMVLFSKYKIIKILGQGGMGKVYLAQDLRDNSLWAIKEELRSGSSMLYNECQILSDVQHPNIPKTQGIFEYDGHAYMIMEFIPGTVLSSLLKKQSYISEAQVQI